MGICQSSSKIRESVVPTYESVLKQTGFMTIRPPPSPGTGSGGSSSSGETILLHDDDETTTTTTTSTMKATPPSRGGGGRRRHRHHRHRHLRTSNSREWEDYSTSAKNNNKVHNQAGGTAGLTSWGVMDIGHVQRMIQKEKEKEDQHKAPPPSYACGTTSWGVMDIDQIQQMISRAQESQEKNHDQHQINPIV